MALISEKDVDFEIIEASIFQNMIQQ